MDYLQIFSRISIYSRPICIHTRNFHLVGDRQCRPIFACFRFWKYYHLFILVGSTIAPFLHTHSHIPRSTLFDFPRTHVSLLIFMKSNLNDRNLHIFRKDITIPYTYHMHMCATHSHRARGSTIYNDNPIRAREKQRKNRAKNSRTKN